MNTEEALKLYKSSRGKLVETVTDLSPLAKIAKTVIAMSTNPEEVSFCNSKGDLELFN